MTNNIPVRGFKATLDNMTCRGYQFELGKSFSVKGPVKTCHNGFHFCKQLGNVFNYYSVPDIGGLRIFEVEGSGDIDHEDDKHACRTITFLRELSIEYLMEHYRHIVPIRHLAVRRKYMLDVLVADEDWTVRYEVARQGYGLDILIVDQDSDVRFAVAAQGYGLDQLMNDSNVQVRAKVAKQGYRLDILIKDNDGIRCEVARQGYGLDVLVNDVCADVRCAVASQGYGLDVLMYDRSWLVRTEVARMGYGVDILINDHDQDVRDTAARKIAELKKTNTDPSMEK